MRLAAVADLHGHLPPVPECDVLVIAGDVTPTSDHDVTFQARWLGEAFAPWLAAAPAAAIVGIAGNHDFVFERAPELVPELPWTYLDDRAATVAGLRFWGSPWTPWFHDWAFNAPRGETEGEAFLAERYATVPDDTDVLVVHGPPRGYGDRTTSGLAAGSPAFLDLIDRVTPSAAIFGHIHEGRGAWDRGPTRLVNAAAVDVARYALVPDPFVLLDL